MKPIAKIALLLTTLAVLASCGHSHGNRRAEKTLELEPGDFLYDNAHIYAQGYDGDDLVELHLFNDSYGYYYAPYGGPDAITITRGNQSEDYSLSLKSIGVKDEIFAMKKVIFLDFDGVLNTGNYTKKLIAAGKPYRDKFGELFDPEAIHNLQTVLDAVPDALLVITSSWKDVYGPAAIRRLWKERSFPGKIHSMTRMCMPSFINDDNEPMMALIKGPEVEQWLEEHEMMGCDYVFFDDVKVFLPNQKRHLVHINPNTGITAKDAKRAIKLLCDEETCNRETR